MVSKEAFLRALNALCKQDREDSYISTHLQMICPDSNPVYITKHAQQGLLDLLEAASGDDEAWISYWLYDLDHGAKYKPGTVRVDGKNVRLKTPEDVYRLLKRKAEKHDQQRN